MTDASLSQHPEKLLQALDFAAEIAAREQEHHEQLRALLLALLEVMDSFDRLLSDWTQQTDLTVEKANVMLNTIRLISRQMESVLRQTGVSPLMCLGQAIDPRKHEIVGARETNEVEPDIILEIVQRGYEWNSQLLRRPRVIVAHNVQEANL